MKVGKVQKDGMPKKNIIIIILKCANKCPAAVLTYLMYMLGDQILFGDGGGRGRRGEGLGGDLL